ncbi:MAG: hypothetical protein HQK96_08045 [Nitrospirae bacterium]|nr:hypothetical protein [Nitrospirota bacterium]
MMKVKFSSPNGVVKILDNTSEMMLAALPAGWKAEIIDEVKELNEMMNKDRVPEWIRCQPSSYMRNIEQPFSYYDREKEVVEDEDADKKVTEEHV